MHSATNPTGSSTFAGQSVVDKPLEVRVHPKGEVTSTGRPTDRDVHVESVNSITSAVGHVKLEGKEYNVTVRADNEKTTTGAVTISIADSGGKNIVSAGNSQLKPEQIDKIRGVLSSTSDGGTALTYKEAAQLAKEFIGHGLAQKSKPVPEKTR